MKPIRYTTEEVLHVVYGTYEADLEKFLRSCSGNSRWIRVFLSTPDARRFEAKLFRKISYITRFDSAFNIVGLIRFMEEMVGIEEEHSYDTIPTDIRFEEKEVLQFLLPRDIIINGRSKTSYNSIPPTIIMKPGIGPVKR